MDRTVNNVIIFNKGKKLNKKNEILLKNVGREGHTYYYYIYNNYDNLNEYTCFLQGDPFDHSPNIIENINKCLFNKLNNFQYLSESIHHSTFKKCKEQFENIHKTWKKIFNTKYDLDKKCVFGAGAQFIVSKEQILKHSKKFYKNIFQILEYSSNPIEGHHIERFHKYIFN